MFAQAHREDERSVRFDDEEDWEDTDAGVPASAGPFLQQAVRGLGIVSNKLTEVALQLAPEDTPPSVVRTAVTGGMVLLAASFIKGIISFFLTIGTIVFAAYVATRVYGVDVSSSSGGGSRGQQRGRNAGASRRRRGEDPPRLLGPWGSASDEEDGGLLDVWFVQSKGKRDTKRPGKRGSKPR